MLPLRLPSPFQCLLVVLLTLSGCTREPSPDEDPRLARTRAQDLRVGPESTVDSVTMVPATRAESVPSITQGSGTFLLQWDVSITDSSAGPSRVLRRHASIPPSGPVQHPSASALPDGWSRALAHDGQRFHSLAWSAAGLSNVRLDSTLAPLDGAGVPMSSGSIPHARIAFDGSGRGLAVWVRGSSIEAALSTSTGTVTPLGVIATLSNGAWSPWWPSVTWGGTGWVVVWGDGTRLLAQRVGTNGALVGGAISVIVSPTASNFDPAVAFDGSKYLVVGSSRTPGGVSRIVGRFLATDGSMSAPEFEVTRTPPGLDAHRPAVAWDGSGFLVAWRDTRNSATSARDVFVNWVTSTGVVERTQDLPAAVTAGDDGDGLTVACDGAGTCALAWLATQAFVVRVSRDRGLIDAAPLECSQVASLHSSPSLGATTNGGLLAWEDSKFGGRDLVARWLDAHGAPIGSESFVVTQAAGTQRSVSVFLQGPGGVAAWLDEQSPLAGEQVYFASLTPGGAPRPAGGTRLEETVGGKSGPAVGGDGTHFLVAWGVPDRVMGTRIDAGGTPLDGRGLVLATQSSGVPDVRAAFGRGTGYAVVWRDTNRLPFRARTVGLTQTLTPVWGPALSSLRSATDVSGLAGCGATDGSVAVVSVGRESGAWVTRLLVLDEQGRARNGDGTVLPLPPSTQPAGTLSDVAVAWDGVRWVAAYAVMDSATRRRDVAIVRAEPDGSLVDSAPVVVGEPDTDEDAPVLAVTAPGRYLLGHRRFVTAQPEGNRRLHVRSVELGADLGEPCTSGRDCARGICAEGVCCDQPCLGVCDSCDGARTVLGAAGVCGPLRAGERPTGGRQCPDTGEPCGADGTCDGRGECVRRAPTGRACGAPECAENVVTTYACGPNGECLSTSTVCPGAMRCVEGGCKTTCASGDDCMPGHHCEAGVCLLQRVLGSVCSRDDQCASGHCVDGVCCDSACREACQSCSAESNVAGVQGRCGPTRAGLDPRGRCPASGGCLADGACDGAGACREFAPAGTPCGTLSCDQAAPVSGVCDGVGECVAAPRTSCFPFACRSGACVTRCSSGADCATGALCDVASAACVVVTTTCADDWTVTDGTARYDCSGYGCVAGSCRQRCGSDVECHGAAGYRCVAGACVRQSPSSGSPVTPPAPPAQSESGCGCRVARSPAAPEGLFGALALFVLALRRRRTLASRAPVLMACLAVACRGAEDAEVPLRSGVAPLRLGAASVISHDSPLGPPVAQNGPAQAAGGGVHLVVWSESGRVLPGVTEIFGARVDSGGGVLDRTGLRISNPDTAAGSPTTAYGGNVFLVAWNGVHGALVNPQGTLVGPPFRVVDAVGDQTSPRAVFDGTHFLVAWTDGRPSAPGIYGARVTTSGVVLDQGGVMLAPDAESSFALAREGARVVMAYRGPRPAPSFGNATYVRSIGPSMALGQPVEVPGVERPTGLACTGSACLMVGTSPSGGAQQGRTARLRTSDLQQTSSAALGTAPSGPLQVSVMGSNFLVAWMDNRLGGSGAARTDVFAARIDPTSGASLDGAGFALFTGPHTTLFYDFHGPPSISVEGGQALVGWTDLRNGGFGSGFLPTIYAARVGSNGSVLDAGGFAVGAAGPRVARPEVTAHGAGYLAGWVEGIGGAVAGTQRSDLWLAVLDPAGVPTASRRLAASARWMGQRGVHMASLGHVAVAAWALEDGIWTTFVDATGAPLPGLAARSETTLASMVLGGVAAGAGQFIIVARSSTSPARLHASRFGATGALLDPAPVPIGSSAMRPVTAPAVGWDGSHFVVVWEDTRRDAGDLWTARVPPSGAPLPETPLVEDIDAQGRVAMGCDPVAGACGLAWSDAREGTEDVRVATLRAAALSPSGGVAVGRNVLTTSQGTPVIAVAFQNGRSMVAWQRRVSSLPVVLQGAWVEENGLVGNVPAALLATDADSADQPLLVPRATGAFLLGYLAYSGPPLNSRRFFVRSLTGAFLGSPCSDGLDCGSGHCVDGVCCNDACGGGDGSDCRSCAVPGSEGICMTDSTRPECLPPPPGIPQPNGEPCVDGDGCTSGHCVEGVCCDASCVGPCRSCRIARTGVASGTCANVLEGREPRAGHSCPVGTEPCGPDGRCGGDGRCREVAPSGATCGIASCEANGQLALPRCDGSGTCAATLMDCSPAVCALGKCASPCRDVRDCAEGYVCIGGGCVGRRTRGEPCDSPEQCVSGHCVDGNCCDSACSGPCVSCAPQNNTSGSPGTCGNTRPGLNPRSGCLPGGLECGAPGSCDGAGQCVAAAPAGTPCGSRTCLDNSVTTSECDGTGKCEVAATQPCELFRCDPDAGQCRTRCAANVDCVPGAGCRLPEGACVLLGNVCSSDGFGIVTPSGETYSCHGYACVAGECQQQCTGAVPCAPDHACVAGACVVAETPPQMQVASESGCGCSTARKPPRAELLALLLAASAFSWRRRGPAAGVARRAKVGDSGGASLRVARRTPRAIRRGS